jgi:cytochrome c biogenesis protein CcmG/thiol:disulfide interchange protein DsbE
MRRFLVPAGAMLAVVAALVLVEVLSGSSGNSNPRPAPPLPPTVLVPPKETVATLRGKPALVTFWASWCDPCRKEAPDLERFSRSLGNRARLIGVAYTDTASGSRSFIRDEGWTFPNLSDPNGTYGQRYRLSGLPSTAVIDAGGRITEVLRGPQTLSTLNDALASVSKR